MGQSVWAYFVVLIGLVSLSLVGYFSGFATNAELDYYAVKEVQTAAMMDSIDFENFRETGAFRIRKATFVEQFMKRFAKAAGNGRKYKVTFTHIVEEPPLTSVLIESEANLSFSLSATADTADLLIKNRQTGILLLNDPVTNIAVGNELEPPKINISVIKKTCTYNQSRREYNTDEPAVYRIKVAAEATDSDLTGMSVTANGVSKTVNNYVSVFNLVNTSAEDKSYEIVARASTGSVSKEVTRTVNIAAGEKCVIPTERPRVYMTPLKACTNFSNVPRVTIEAKCTTCIPEVEYTITKDGGASVTRTFVGNKKTIDIIDQLPPTASERNETVNYRVVAKAYPEGSDSTFESLEQPVGNYTIIGGNNNFTFNPNSSNWTNQDIDIRVTPNFNFGQSNDGNTEWNWHTNRSMDNANWDGYDMFSKNFGPKTKTISKEGYRQVKGSVLISGSLIGPGCMDQNFEKESGIYKIDKTPPVCKLSYSQPSGYSSGKWTNQNVTVVGTCQDALSGCKAPTVVSKTISAEGIRRVSPGTVCDNATNCTTCGELLVKIDKTPPTFSLNCDNMNPYCVYDRVYQNLEATFPSLDDNYTSNGDLVKIVTFNPDGVNAFIHGTAMNERHTIRAKVTDLAGNSTSDSVSCPYRYVTVTPVPPQLIKDWHCTPPDGASFQPQEIICTLGGSNVITAGMYYAATDQASCNAVGEDCTGNFNGIWNPPIFSRAIVGECAWSG